MTDGRIAGHWIGDPRFDEMSVDAWCVFTKAITWSNERGTDGKVPMRYLLLLHPEGPCQPAHDELEAMNLWVRVQDGYQLQGWNVDTRSGGLGQETAVRVREQRDRRKRTQQAYRDRKKKDQVSLSTGDVTGNEADNEAGNVGQDEDRTGRGQAVYSSEYQNSEFDHSDEPSQPVFEDFADPITGQRRQRRVA